MRLVRRGEPDSNGSSHVGRRIEICTVNKERSIRVAIEIGNPARLRGVEFMDMLQRDIAKVVDSVYYDVRAARVEELGRAADAKK